MCVRVYPACPYFNYVHTHPHRHIAFIFLRAFNQRIFIINNNNNKRRRIAKRERERERESKVEKLRQINIYLFNMLRFVCNCCPASASVCVCKESVPPNWTKERRERRDCDSGREESVLPTTFIHFVALIHSYVRALYLSFIARLSRQNKTNNNNNKTRKKTRSFSFILTARVEEKKFSASAAAAWSHRGVEMQLMNGGNSSNNYNFDLGLRDSDGNGDCDCGCLAVCLPTRGTLSCFCYFFVSLLCSSSAAATVASLSSLSCCHCCCCSSLDGWCLFPSFLRVLRCPPQQSSCKPAWATTALLLLLRQLRRGRGVFSSALTARLRCVLFCLSRSCDCIYFDFSCCCCCFFILFIHNLESDSPNAHLWTAATNQLLRCDSGQRGGGVDCAASATRHLLRLCVRVCVSHSHLSFVLI